MISVPSERQRDSLVLGERLGEGAQGKVYALEGEPMSVYKEYLAPESSRIDARGLDRLIRWRSGLPETTRDALDRRSAWLESRVTAGGRTVGVTMKRVPPQFMGTVRSGPTLQELMYLLFRPRPAWSSLSLPSDEQRLGIAKEVVRLVEMLHGQNLILGDISMKNLLWTTSTAAPAVFLIDCDSVRLSGYHPPVPQLHTPDWDDPHVSSNAATLDSDRYKLACAVIRILCRDAYLRPGGELVFVPGVPDRVVEGVLPLSRRASGMPGARPTANEWLQALSERPSIALDRRDRAPLPQMTSAIPAPTERPVIQLRHTPTKP